MNSTCAHCSEALVRRPCGCWTGRLDDSRWCSGGQQLHAPNGSTQPETCCGIDARHSNAEGSR